MAATKIAPMYPVNDTTSMVGESIPKGYYLKARKIEESEIAHTPPHIREIWDWLIKSANFADKVVYGRLIKRGQLFTSYKEVQDGLHWMVGYRKETYSKSQCETAMKWLVKRGMIHTTKTTRGLIVTICKYDTYQSIENYENRTENHNRTTTEPQSSDTIHKESKRKNKEGNSVASASKPKSFKVWTEEEFIAEIGNFKEYYHKDTLNRFFKYWKENSATGKMRFQLEKTWDTKLRLENWQRIEDTKK